MKRTRKQFAAELEADAITCIDCDGRTYLKKLDGSVLCFCRTCDADGKLTAARYAELKAERLADDDGEKRDYLGGVTFLEYSFRKHEGGRRPARRTSLDDDARQWIDAQLVEAIDDYTRNYFRNIRGLEFWQLGSVYRPALTPSLLRDELAQYYQAPAAIAGKRRGASIIRSRLASLVKAGKLSTIHGLGRDGHSEVRVYEPTDDRRAELEAEAAR